MIKQIVKSFAILSIAILSHCTWASTECYFPGGIGTKTISGNLNVLQQSGVSTLAFLGEFNLGNLGTNSECKNGTGGKDVTSRTVATPIFYADNHAVYATSISGIGYGVWFKCVPAGDDGCAGHKNETYGVADNWDEASTGGAWYPYETRGQMSWQTIIRVYQLPSYVYRGPQTAKAISGELFQWQIGVASQPIAHINASSSLQINLTGSFATCAAAVSDSGNTINLGDYYASELRNNPSPKKVPFSITFSGCYTTSKITTKITSNYVSTTNKNLLANKNGDMGAGVEISSATDTVIQPNNTSSSFTDTDNSQPSTRKIAFNATLKDDGKGTISAGSFETAATLTFTYE